jgi:hypothetical protein
MRFTVGIGPQAGQDFPSRRTDAVILESGASVARRNFELSRSLSVKNKVQR